MLQQEKPEDFVIASGNQKSVREFIELSANEIGVSLRFEGEGINEIGIVESVDLELAPKIKKGDIIIKVDSRYFRPAEVDSLIGSSLKAKKILKWKPKHNIHSLIEDMITYELKILNNVE